MAGTAQGQMSAPTRLEYSNTLESSRILLQSRLRRQLWYLYVAARRSKLHLTHAAVVQPLLTIEMRVLRVAALVAAANAFVAARARIQAAGLHAIDAT